MSAELNRLHRRMRLLATWLMCAWLGAALASGVQNEGIGDGASHASMVVDGLHRVLHENLRDGEALGIEGRQQRLYPVVSKSFDFSTIARVALGNKAFDALDSAQQTRFIRLLTLLSVATYAEQFSGTQSPVRLVTISERPARGHRILVKTHLQRPAKEPVTLDYVIHDTPRGPQIINVLANGVSDLSLKRAQYAAVIRGNGVDALFQRIEEQLRELTGPQTGG